MGRQMAVVAVLVIALAVRGAGAEARPAGTACRGCHTAERPTRGHAELAPCTRVEPRGLYRPADGPENIVMSEGTGYYGRVEFSHRIHAEMAETGRGCRECHHEATADQPMRRCGECHARQRAREDLETPDLRGAIHRQCMGCHAQWKDDVRCDSCHLDAGVAPRPARDGEAAAQRAVLYRFHRGMACAQCHPVEPSADRPASACASCHDDWPESFRHEATGVALSKDHQDAACDDCHPGANFAAPPVCADCHDDMSYPDNLPGSRVSGPAPIAEGAAP